MNVILKEIEKRQKKLNEYEAKVEELEMLKAKTACLEKEVSETNTFELKDEIKELTDYAIQLRLIEAPVAVEEPETLQEVATEEIVEQVTHPTLTSI